ncbi:MAG TPA: hypothetical protein VFE07_16755 [Marmoricola sp.]|nr:hypothetical protein [Marmoricola sp.]
MNDFEDRVREALRTDVRDVEPEQLLADVHKGATRRRRRRVAGTIAAAVVVIAGAAGVATTIRGDEGTSPEPIPATQAPTPTPTPTQPTLPAGATQGVIDVSAVSSDSVYRLTTNVGCVACSTVWRRAPGGDGPWERLHDFGADAYVGKVNAAFGPVTNLVMARGTDDGWAWGQRLYATHDGGRTWTHVTTGPGRIDGEFGHQVVLTDKYAWSLLRTDSGTELWSTSLGSDEWTRVDAPNMSGVSDMAATADQVALNTSDEGLSGPRYQYSTDGRHWDELDNPCAGENQIYTTDSAAFIICADQAATEASPSSSATVYRTTDFSSWARFGRSTGVITGVHPLDGDHLLVIGDAGSARVLTADGAEPVEHLDLAPGVETFESSSAQGVSYLVTSDNRLWSSQDDGMNWHPVGP